MVEGVIHEIQIQTLETIFTLSAEQIAESPRAWESERRYSMAWLATRAN